MAEANSESAIITADQIKKLSGTLTVQENEGLSYAIIRKILKQEDPKKFGLKEVRREYDKLKADVDAKNALTTLIQEIEKKLPEKRGRKESSGGADWGKIVWVNETIQLPTGAPAPAAGAARTDADPAKAEYNIDDLEKKGLSELIKLLGDDHTFKNTTKDHINTYKKTDLPNIINAILGDLGFDTEPGQYNNAMKENTKTLQGVLKNLGLYNQTPHGIFGLATLRALNAALSDPKIGEAKLKEEIAKKQPTTLSTPTAGTPVTLSESADTSTNNLDNVDGADKVLAQIKAIEGLKGVTSLKSLGFTVVNGTLTPPTGLELVPETTDQYEVNEYYEVVNGSIQPRNPDNGGDYSNGVLTAIKDIPGLENTKDLKSLGFRVNSNNELVFPVGILEENDDSIKIASYAHVVQGTIQLKEGFTSQEGTIHNETIDQLSETTLETIKGKGTQINEHLDTIRDTLDKETINNSIAVMKGAMEEAKALSDTLKEKEGDYNSSQRSVIDGALEVMQSAIEGATEIQAGLDTRIGTLQAIGLQINKLIGDGFITKDEFTTIRQLLSEKNTLFTTSGSKNTEEFLDRVEKEVDELSFYQTKLELYTAHEFTLDDGIVRKGYTRALPKGATSTVQQAISERQGSAQ